MTGSAVRPRQRLAPDVRRAQLCEAAVAVVADGGYAAATADAIAREAGVSKGLLWHYFEDRDALLHETAVRTLTVLQGAVGAQIDLAAPVPALIRSAVHAAAALVQSHAAERRALQEIILNLRAEDGSLRLGLEDLRGMHEAQAAIFRRGQVDGDIRKGLDPMVLALTYQGAVDAMLGHLEQQPEVDPGPVADAVADVLLSGAATPRRGPRTPRG